MVRAALVQFNMELEQEKNIAKAKRYTIEAARREARIICLPELFNTVYFCPQMDVKYCSWAEPIPGPTTEEMAQIAREEQIVIIAPIFEKTITGQLYNTAAVLGPDGQLIGKYRKSHIPELGLGGTHEKFYFTPGDTGFITFATPFGVTFGVLICWDRHYPEAARLIALNGADVLFVASGSPEAAKPLWEIELMTWAYTNVYYVGGVNRVGKDVGGPAEGYFFGRSLFIAPTGEIISQAGEKEDEIVYADLDLSLLEELRNSLGLYRDRRPDLYSGLLSR